MTNFNLLMHDTDPNGKSNYTGADPYDYPWTDD